MKKSLLVMTAIAAVTAFATTSFAQSSITRQTPGHEMQRRGSVKGQPGASGYAPGHLMQQRGSRRGHPGASGYAPGHETTTGQGAQTTGQRMRR